MDQRNIVGFTVITIIAAILTTISYYSEKKNPIVVGKSPDAAILVLRFVHFFAVMISLTYIFLFTPELDIYYIIFTIFLYGHWLFFKNECILSYIEKIYYRKECPLGDLNMANIYLNVVFRDYTNTMLLIFGFLSLVNFLIVIGRQQALSSRLRLGICIAFLAYVVVIVSVKRV